MASEIGAAFGWRRTTLGRFAGDLARPILVEKSLAPIGTLGVEALIVRSLHELRAARKLGQYAGVAFTPGFARAAAKTIQELRLARAEPSNLASAPAELVQILQTYETLLNENRLADRADVLESAVQAVVKEKQVHALVGRPALFLDVPIWTRAEAALIAAYSARSTEVLATVPASDTETLSRLKGMEFAPVSAPALQEYKSSLERLSAQLFKEEIPSPAVLDDSVTVLSAPGEARESVEIVRQLLVSAQSGIPFDRMAVFLRAGEEYRPHLEAAFARAEIPAHFVKGTLRPDPAGRAFLALLACGAERLSARRFAEYLSLAQVPDATSEGQPPAAPPTSDRWVPPDEELIPEVIAAALVQPEQGRREGTSHKASDPETATFRAGTLRAPRRWEQLLVDAAVIGGQNRWKRRLTGLEAKLRLDLEAIDDPDGPEGDRCRRRMADLAALGDFALPLVGDLSAFPESATWGDWIERLSGLATRSLRFPDRVLSVLAELAPMATVTGVTLRDVQLVLSARHLEIAVPPSKSRYGAVFVAHAEEARGMTFDVVSVPGLAEKLFPREIREEPLLLDPLRDALDLALPTNRERVRRERLHLAVVVGAASSRIVLSYPRLDLEKARPRVPSFYCLEVFRAAEGRLPGFGELASRAESVVETRVGWPAPEQPEDAIDAAEYDLALLKSLLSQGEEQSAGTAAFLLSTNPHLARALRFRARRWLRRWTSVDGLVEPSAEAAVALSTHRLAARSYSATALEQYAACPYRFFLHAVQRLAPRDMPEPIDELDPLQLGSLVHEVQFSLFRRLQAEDSLPVTMENLGNARDRLDRIIDTVAERFHEELRPAIERVWQDGIAGIRADLREWLRRVASDASGFVPSHFELAFGLTSGHERDRESRPDPVPLESGIQLRGSIDLVERHADGRVRVTDHKTGRVRLPQNGIFAGGTVLQPVLYALAAEKLFSECEVTEGRLFYCTTAGEFQVRSMALDEGVRGSAKALADAVSEALAEGFFPALPQKGACTNCDYRIVCGPYEEFRTGRKPTTPRPLSVSNS